MRGMASLICPDCSTQFDITGKACPKCGRPNPQVSDQPARLLACPDCGGQMSRSAASCPHCGWRPPPKSKFTKDLGVGSWLFVLGIFVAIFEPLRAVGGLMVLIGVILVIVRLAQRD